MTAPIDFYFDFSSPYAFIASEWIDDLAARHGRSVHWHAILLGVTFRAAELRSPVAYPLKREYALRDFERSGRFEGVRLALPEPFPIATHQAARVFAWLQADDPGRAVAWAHAALRAHFQQGRSLGDPGVLRAISTEEGLDADAAESAWNDPVWKDRLRQENEAAIAAGVFGAPFFIVDGEPFWGNDRKAQLERWLAEGGF